ncbi:flagellar biosynthesis protein FlhB [Thermodesulfobacteriota bacterium]
MPEESFQEKTEPATPKKRREAQKKGQVAKSKELSSIAVLSAGILYLFFGGKGMVLELGNLIEQSVNKIPHIVSGDLNLLFLAMWAAEKFLWMTLPIMATMSVVAVLVNLSQTGFIWSVEPLAPKASKIDPIKGFTRIFSKRGLVELAKSMAKIIMVAWAAYSTLKGDFSRLIPLVYAEENQVIALLGQLSLKVLIRCCWVIAILAILDFLYQKWDHEQKLKMTKQEVKDENKQSEGDPQVKARIRSIQRDLARRRMMEEVPKADVVITNPVHLAIAVSYEPQSMSAPIIVAKGAKKLAARIRRVALDHDVPLVENRSLAQNLYKLELGEEIPPQFYQVVAEILAYVYSLKNENIARG